MKNTTRKFVPYPTKVAELNVLVKKLALDFDSVTREELAKALSAVSDPALRL